jgi:hypothetical protein
MGWLSTRSPIHILAVTNSKHQHHNLLVLNVANETIVAHSVPPQSAFVSVQWPAPLSRVVSGLQPFPQKADDRFLGRAV